MAELFQFELVSPEKLLISEDVEMVVVPGSEGDFAILKGHAPVMSTLKPGVVEIQINDKEQQRVFVRGGFAEAGPDSLTILAEKAILMEDLDADTLAQEIQNAEEDVNDAKSDEMQAKAQEQLDQLKQLQSSL
ncbi:MAG: F0F1 ATP synthase subunit epsilon [Rhizobiales bacterium]|nr:F0F1 ATP synthase subunit epsilon [Hyphomicrobiales bacterium]